MAADGLVVEDLRVSFGGRHAVEGLTLTAPVGVVTGLIGPNGAGKTTSFNACSGLLRPSSGRIGLFGEDVTGLPPHRRAQRGLGRTFQRMELFNSLTVRENVALGREAGLAGSSPWRHILAQRSELPALGARVEENLDLCGITKLAERLPKELSTGQRRLVELARVLCGEFRILLLDEPSSGLDKSETLKFGEVLRRVVTERGAGLLLVEHDMALVMSTCDYIHVLDFGVHIFEGKPGDVARSDIVRAAYLGSTAEDAAEATKELS